MARPTFTEMTLLDDIQKMDQREDPDIAYPPVATAMALMPGTKLPLSERVWTKGNGRWVTSWIAGTNARTGNGTGLPGGGKGRIIVAKFAQLAVRNQHPLIEMPGSEAGYMRELGLAASGGAGNSKALTAEMTMRVVRSSIVAQYDPGAAGAKFIGGAENGMRFCQSFNLWWSRDDKFEHPVAGSYVMLDPLFYQLIKEHPLPLNLDALRILAGSALAQDLYSWLTYRLRTLEHPVTVTWEQLTHQFGTKGLPPVDAPKSGRSRAISEAKRNIRKQMPMVLAVYHKAKVFDTDRGLELRPSPPHVPERGMHGVHRAISAASYAERKKAAAAADAKGKPPLKVPSVLGSERAQLPFQQTA